MQTKVRGIDSVSSDERDIKATPSGALFVQQVHGRYHEAVRSGRVYVVANQTGCIWTVGLATTYTGICLTNPIGSDKVLSILKAGFFEVVAPAGIQAVYLAGGFNATTAVTQSVAETPLSMLVGRVANGVALGATGATLPTAPKLLLPLQTGKTSAALSTASTLATADVDGIIEVLPGGYVIVACFTVGAAVGQYGAIVYEEID